MVAPDAVNERERRVQVANRGETGGADRDLILQRDERVHRTTDVGNEISRVVVRQHAQEFLVAHARWSRTFPVPRKWSVEEMSIQPIQATQARVLHACTLEI